jgi:predicted acyl esterase
VGVFGISYPGFYSTMAALSNHPALKAVSPQAPVTDWFIGDDFHHNGAFMMMDAFDFYTSFGRPRPKPTSRPQGKVDYFTKDNYRFFLENGTLSNLTRTTWATVLNSGMILWLIPIWTSGGKRGTLEILLLI